MNLLTFLTIALTATHIRGLPADYNGYPGLQQYYEKYKYSPDNSDSEMGGMEEAKSKTENEYPQGVLSDSQYSEETNLSSDNVNISDSTGEFPSYLRQDYEEKNKDFPQSGDIYPTQPVSEEEVTVMESEDFNQEEGNTSSVTQASSVVESLLQDENEDENSEDNFPVTLHVEGVDNDGNQSLNNEDHYEEDPTTEIQLEGTPEPGFDYDIITASDDLTVEGNQTRVQYEGLDDDEYQEDPTTENRLEVTSEPALDHDMITASDDLTVEGNQTRGQYKGLDDNGYQSSNELDEYPEDPAIESRLEVTSEPGLDHNMTTASENKFDNERYLEEQEEFTAVFEDEEETNTNGTEVPENSPYNITDDSVETQTYSNEYDNDPTTPSEFILSQTEVERTGDTLEDAQTIAPTVPDYDSTDSGEISDQEEITQRNFVDDDQKYNDDENNYEDDTDEHDYDDDDYEEDENDSEKYEESTWQNEEETVSSHINDDYEDIVKQLEKTEHEFRENILKAFTTDAPAGPRYRSSIVPMILLALLIIGTLLLCTRAPAYFYNLFRILKEADPFRRRLEKKGYMVLPMGDKSV